MKNQPCTLPSLFVMGMKLIQVVRLLPDPSKAALVKIVNERPRNGEAKKDNCVPKLAYYPDDRNQ